LAPTRIEIRGECRACYAEIFKDLEKGDECALPKSNLLNRTGGGIDCEFARLLFSHSHIPESTHIGVWRERRKDPERLPSYSRNNFTTLGLSPGHFR
jgi:hypothetical protein